MRASHNQRAIVGLSFVGITFTGTRFPMPEGGFAGAQASTMEARNLAGTKLGGRRALSAAVKVENATNCRFDHCRFVHLGGSGLWLGGRAHNCTIERSTFDVIGGNGINLGEDNSRRVDGETWYETLPEQVPTSNVVRGCEVSRCGQVLPGSVGIWGTLQRQLDIAENHIHDCPYSGISLGWIWNDSKSPAQQNSIRGNRIEHVMQVLSDGGGIYTLGRQPGSVLEKNTISDIPTNLGRAESNGMFLDEGTTGFVIRENVFHRISRSPLRFHKAGENQVVMNSWELATPTMPPVRFNNTPETSIKLDANEVLSRQTSIYLIGNSLTWDTQPPLLDGDVQWHVDCSKSLAYIQQHPESPCVATSRNWPLALRTKQYDFVVVQPHYGTTIEEDLSIISTWVGQQRRAVFVIHSGWARHATFFEELAVDDVDAMTHSRLYFETLRSRLQERFPQREFRSTNTTPILAEIADDILADRSPFKNLNELYRDAIHMTHVHGRMLMHNAMRNALDQQPSTEGFPEIEPEVLMYLLGKIKKD